MHTAGDVVHVCRHDEMVTLWMHYVSEHLDPRGDTDYPLIVPTTTRDATNNERWATVRVTIEPSNINMLCHAHTVGGFGKYVFLEDVFMRRDERLRVSCSPTLSGRLLVSGGTSRMDGAVPP